ncbi:MAG: M24 family metallopeptidase, partial [Clostridia bacterium]|nr:M24 family metallopeptidase [Clostridia bacterium]
EEFSKSNFSSISKLIDIKSFIEVLKSKNIEEINIESSISLSLYTNIFSRAEIKKCQFIDNDINALRKIKSENEIENMKKAQAITDKSFSEVLNYIKEGITERELAGILESLMFKNGASELAFKSIVAFQENASKPHCLRSDRKLKYGDLILMDFGAKYNNYCSDMTRTVFFGECNDENKKIYNIVLDCQKYCLDTYILGTPINNLNNNAIEFFDKIGYKEQFIHSLGHGVGIDIHEQPFFSSNEKFSVGNVITCEPGLYIPNKLGIRIEDMVYMSSNGLINLTKSPKNIIII